LNLQNITRHFEHTGFEIAQKRFTFIFDVSTNEMQEFSLFSTLWTQWRTKRGVEATIYVCSWNVNFTVFRCPENLNSRLLVISHSLIPKHSVTPVIFHLISSFHLVACCLWPRLVFVFLLPSNRSVVFCSLR
jgi:hypothetical protein